jgi:hypothetical protein
MSTISMTIANALATIDTNTVSKEHLTLLEPMANETIETWEELEDLLPNELINMMKNATTLTKEEPMNAVTITYKGITITIVPTSKGGRRLLGQTVGWETFGNTASLRDQNRALLAFLEALEATPSDTETPDYVEQGNKVILLSVTLKSLFFTKRLGLAEGRISEETMKMMSIEKVLISRGARYYLVINTPYYLANKDRMRRMRAYLAHHCKEMTVAGDRGYYFKMEKFGFSITVADKN